jgi:hypothetical protein
LRPKRETTTKIRRDREQRGNFGDRHVYHSLAAGIRGPAKSVSGEEGAGPSFPNKISNPAAAPSLSLRSLQGQGGELDLPSSAQGDQNPRSSCGAPGVPARPETRQERGTLED